MQGYNGNFAIHNQRIFYGDLIEENGMCLVEGTRVIIQKFVKIFVDKLKSCDLSKDYGVDERTVINLDITCIR